MRQREYAVGDRVIAPAIVGNTPMAGTVIRVYRVWWLRVPKYEVKRDDGRIVGHQGAVLRPLEFE